MSRTPTVLQICPPYVDLEAKAGGVSNVVRYLSRRLADRGWMVHIVCGAHELGERKGTPGTYRSGNIIRHILDDNGVPWWGPIRELGKRVSSLARKADITHVHTCFSVFSEYSMGCLRKRDYPFVFTPHGKFSPRMLNQRYLLKWLWWHGWTKSRVRNAEKLVLLYEAENLNQLGLGASDAVIPNGFDAKDSAYQEGLASDPPVDEPYILFLGYLDPRKQPELLVRAYAQSAVQESHRLVLAGPDAYGHESVVEETIRECGVSSRVTLYGPAYGAEKWALLSGATCFCLPSKGEGRPVTASEALGAGTPVLISRQSNFPEIAEQGAGIECDAFDEIAWSRALEAACHDEQQREMQKAAEALAEDFTWASVVDQWEEVYRDVISE